MSQIGIPNEVTTGEIAREKTLGGAIGLCAKAAGYDLDKQLTADLEADKAQVSRWLHGTEGIIWPKLRKLMDLCGNHAPVLWMLHDLGYDISSLRKRETLLEQELREERERVAQMEVELSIYKKIIGVKAEK